MGKFPIIALLVLITSACGEKVTPFEQPQPEGTKNLKTIPAKLTGTFQEKVQGSVLTITPQMLVKDYKYQLKFDKNQLDSGVVLKGNLLIDLKEKDTLAVTIAGDTLIHEIPGRDTIFNIGEGDILRKFKGNYFFNSSHGEKTWQVRSLTYSHGKILFREFESENDYKKLQAILGMQADSAESFNPSRKQFKKFVKEGGFSKKEMYFRIK